MVHTLSWSPSLYDAVKRQKASLVEKANINNSDTLPSPEKEALQKASNERAAVVNDGIWF